MIQTVPNTPFRPAAFTMPARARFRGHSHAAWHLLWVRSGGFEEADSAKSLHLRAGQFRLSRAGCTHDIAAGDAVVDLINFHVHDRRLASRLNARFAADHTVLDCLDEDEDLAELDGLELEERLYNLLPRLERQARGDDPEPDDWMLEARARLARPEARVSSVAAHFGLTREHFSRTYARIFGMTPQQARKQAALRHVLHLIETTDAPLSDVALEAGYCDQGHMSNAVRAKLGRTPLQLRRAA